MFIMPIMKTGNYSSLRLVIFKNLPNTKKNSAVSAVFSR